MHLTGEILLHAKRKLCGHGEKIIANWSTFCGICAVTRERNEGDFFVCVQSCPLDFNLKWSLYLLISPFFGFPSFIRTQEIRSISSSLKTFSTGILFQWKHVKLVRTKIFGINQFNPMMKASRLVYEYKACKAIKTSSTTIKTDWVQLTMLTLSLCY